MKVLTKAETECIVNELKAGATINQLREKTRYGVNTLKKICVAANIIYTGNQSHKDRVTTDFSGFFVENSKISNHAIIRCIKQHNLISYNECYHCGLSNWLKGVLTLELDHINGNNRDNRLNNLRFLCPNCHSQTDTYKGKSNTGKKKVSDEDLTRALKETNNIRQALIQVGLTPKGANYDRANKLMLFI
jgi:5-methylcytosine-specific restriction endonuclease McrA